jgi:hypothetical protein
LPGAWGPLPGEDRRQLAHEQLEDRCRRRAGIEHAVPVAEESECQHAIGVVRRRARHEGLQLAPGNGRHVGLERHRGRHVPVVALRQDLADASRPVAVEPVDAEERRVVGIGPRRVVG